MELKYYCKECCDELDKYFSKDAENEVGRKCCSRCGTNEPCWFKVEIESELDY